MRVKAIDNYTLEVLGEKHTLLNLIRWCITRFETVHEIELVGYTIPHPMEDKAVVKIQLVEKDSQEKGEILKVFQRGIEAAQKILKTLSISIEKNI